MIYSNRTVLKASVAIVFSAALMTAPIAMAHEHEKENLAAPADKTVTGEIVDVMCYVDHGAVGEKHAALRVQKCIEGGGPVADRE